MNHNNRNRGKCNLNFLKEDNKDRKIKLEEEIYGEFFLETNASRDDG